MKILLSVCLCLISHGLIAQDVEKIEVPKGVVYKYCDTNIIAKAKAVIDRELSDKVDYTMNKGLLFVGPVLWSRFKKIPALAAIKNGDMTITAISRKEPSGKMTQNAADFKLVWDQVRAEVSGNTYQLRKATPAELQYYWSVISFDIDEPLLIIQTSVHNYLLNFSKDDLTLVWLDETPRQ
jgi:cellobiose-specific phosphotransferase system component IIB